MGGNYNVVQVELGEFPQTERNAVNGGTERNELVGACVMHFYGCCTHLFYALYYQYYIDVITS